MSQSISAADPHPRRRAAALDTEIAYVSTGAGAPVVFLHGNPTSSYLWRNVIPWVAPDYHCLAPDLVGMGDSGKSPAGSYRFADHARYLDAWLDAMGLSGTVTLVMHDWGSALGFHWAHRHPDRVRALVYMEALVRPVTWDEWPEAARKVFQGMRGPAGEEMVLAKNVFVERILPASVLRGLGEAEMAVYRRPYLEPGESRRPTLTWPRQIPIDGEPADVVAIVEAYATWLSASAVPKLFVNADPGSILTGALRDFCRTWPNQQEITVSGTHFIQEDSPAEIGQAIAAFLEEDSVMAGASTPRPFTVRVPDDVLADLKARLERARFPDEVPGSGWQYGSDLAYVKDLVTYWRDRFDWRAQERLLNAWPQFTVPIGDVDVHFIHAEGKGPRPMPLLLSHGWPGSVWEFHKILPLLTDPGRHGGNPEDAFTVVAPSLPGYGFSFAPNQPRFNIAGIADTFARLMTDVLGYRRFAAQGGDWGAFITSMLGLAYPDRLAGIHITLLGVRRDLAAPDNPTEEEKRYLEELRRWEREETGYQWIQGTKPQTLAYGLTDSPVGLAAWIAEKFRTWSDCGGDIERRFSKDVLLTNVMLYWVTGAINSSFWPYYARRHEPWPIPDGQRITVPTAYASFPGEILHPPRAWAERAYNITRWTPMPAGGHFAALEEPEALAADVRAFFRPLR